MHGDSRPPPSLDRLADGFRVAGWTVVPRANELVRSGETVHVEPKPMEVLVYLAAHAGEPVSREALMEDLWPDTFVTEHALNRCVSQLRKLFDDDPRQPSVIETIPKSGYRLIAPVEPLAGEPLPTAANGAAPNTNRPAPASARRMRWPLVLGLLALAATAGALLFAGDADHVRPAAIRPLTSAPGVETQAALSPDGSRIAYVHQPVVDRSGDLFVLVLGSDTPLQLTDTPEQEVEPAWSPDGRRIAFLRCPDERCAVYTVSALGQDERLLADAGASWWGSLDWSPDGRHLAFVRRDAPGQPAHVVLLDLDTGEERTMTRPPADTYGDVFPRFSPDGRHLAFDRVLRVGVGDLFVMPVEGGEERRLTSDGRYINRYTWTPDGRELVMASNRAGLFQLWRVDVEDPAPALISSVAAREPGGPTLRGETLVLEEWDSEVNLWEASLDGTETPRRVVASTQWDKQPHLAPDGTRIAFVSNRSGALELWTAAPDGTGTVRLTHFDGQAVEHPRWSPDGRRIAFVARPSLQADLYVIDAAGGQPRRLTRSDADDVLPRWSRDGRWLYFGSKRSGEWQIWRMPAAGGEPGQVTEGGGFAAEESLDGRWLLFTKYAEPGLWRRPLAGGAEERVVATLDPAYRSSWAVTADGVVFLDGLGRTPRLARYDFVTGAVSPLSALIDEVVRYEPSLTVTADGRLVFARQDRVEADLMLVENFE